MTDTRNLRHSDTDTAVSRYMRDLAAIKGNRYEFRGESGFEYLEGKPTNRRLFISGRPGSGKTASADTFDRPIMIINCPGEIGVDSIPRGADIQSVVFQHKRGENYSSNKVLSDFMYEVHQAVNNSNIQTIFIDGVHKLHEYFLDIATNHAHFHGVSYDSRLYGPAHTLFNQFLTDLFYAPTPVVVFTTWCEREYLDPDLTTEQKRMTPRYVLPSMPGKMATHFMGLVNSGGVHADITPSCNMPNCEYNAKKRMHFTWQLRQNIDAKYESLGIAGNRDCGFKLPKGYELPTLIHQDWQYLKKLLDAAWE